MADIDWGAFGMAFAARLDANGLSREAARRAWPATDAAMLFRATHGERLAAGNFVLLCGLAGLDPHDFLLVAKRVKRRRATLRGIRESLMGQALTQIVPRETSPEGR